MANRNSTQAPALLIPRFVHNFNAMAKRCGLSVSVSSGRELAWNVNEADEQDILIAVWRGSQSQLRATGHFSPAYNFPSSGGPCQFSSARARGYMFKEGRDWIAEVDCGPIPLRIETRGAVEVIHYENETAYHGTSKNLISAKVCTKKNFPSDKRIHRIERGWDGARQWATSRLHDGTYVYRLEDEGAYKMRLAEEEQHKKEFDKQNTRQPDETKEPYTVSIDYGDHKLSCVIVSYDSRHAALEALTGRHLPAEFVSGKPVYWSFEIHGRYAAVSNDAISFGPKANTRSVVYKAELSP